MRFVIQRVTSARVDIDGETVGSIGKGYMVLIGVGKDDTEETADKYLSKMLKLRIFEDENGKTNKSLADVNGELLLVSQFTLYADCHHGNRPSFITAAKPEYANELYEYFMEQLRANGIKKVEHGLFGADMQVEIHNDGPVTIIMDTTIWNKRD